MLPDIRYALRSFRKSPAFAAVAVLSLALGIGANTAVFTLTDRILLRRLPVRQPGDLVLLTANGPRRGWVETAYDDTYTFSYPMYRDFRDRAPAVRGVLAWNNAAVSFTHHGNTERVQANLVSGNFFDVLGVPTMLGRPITPDDDRMPAGSPVVVLSHAFWVQRFGADPAILNQNLIINGHSLTVIGIAAPSFQGLAVGEAPSLFMPLTTVSEMVPGHPSMSLTTRRAMWLNVIARLQPGVTRAGAESALNAFWRPILETELKEFSQPTAATRQHFLARHITLLPAASGISALRQQFGEPLVLLMALVGLVLLIACANVANLLIARATGRQKEIAIRLALGARRSDIVRQGLIESLLLACAGGTLGMLFATWSGDLLLRMLPTDQTTAGMSTAPDLRILAFTAAIAMLSGLLFGLLPALQATRPNIAPILKDQAGSVLGSSSQARFRKVLVVAQVALSLLLLVGAGLFLKSLGNLQNLNLGFRADHLMSFAVNPTLSGYDRQHALALFDRLAVRARSLPGVMAVATSQIPILAGDNAQSTVVVPGREQKEDDSAPNVDGVNPGYFAAFGLPLLEGREFTAADGANAPRVAVVNQAFARAYFNQPNPLGRQFYFGGDKARTPVEVVGVVRDAKYADLREAQQLLVYCPYAQYYVSGSMTFYIRSREDPSLAATALRQAVREADANLPVFAMKSLERQIAETTSSDHLVSALSAAFGLLATLLAAIGLYGVMAYSVARRTRELGIRLALGASRGSVLSLVLSEVGVLVGMGVAIAVPASYPLTSLAQSMLFGVGAHDPWILAGAVGVLLFTALLAAYVPAFRATHVDPLTALRHE